MSKYLVVVLLLIISPAAAVAAGPDTRIVPQHETICTKSSTNPSVYKNVDQQKLAMFLLSRHPMSAQLASSEFNPVSDGKFGTERWRLFITDKQFCSRNSCQPADVLAINSIKADFVSFVSQGRHMGIYSTDNPNIGPDEYFTRKDANSIIQCSQFDRPPAVPMAGTVPDNNPIRIRGLADDLYLDRLDYGFGASSKASIAATGDSSATPHTQSYKTQIAVGYAKNVVDTETTNLTVIPYLAANESFSLTKGKAQTDAPYNFVAGGVMFTTEVNGSSVFSLRPQYQENTTQNAQLASFRAIYVPYTRAEDSRPFPPLNTPFALSPDNGVQPPITGQLLFDLRADIGDYSNRGSMSYVQGNQNFARFGTKAGFSFSTTPANLPTFTFTATETLLYGAAGSLRNLNLFEASLTASLDAHNYYGLTLGYTNGFNEDTAVSERTYTLGFSAHL